MKDGAAGGGPGTDRSQTADAHLDLSTRIATLLALLVLATTAVLVTLIFSRYHRVLAEGDRGEIERESELLAMRFQTHLRELDHDIQFLAGTPPIRGLERSLATGDAIDPMDGSSAELWRRRLETIFSSLLASKPHYAQARYIGLADGGRELVRVDHYGEAGGTRVVRGDELQQKGLRDYVAEGSLSPEGETWFSRIELNREHGKIMEPREATVRAVAAVRDADGVPYGIVVLNADMNHVFRELRELPGPGYAVSFLDQDGNELDAVTSAHPQSHSLPTSEDPEGQRFREVVTFGAANAPRSMEIALYNPSPRASRVTSEVAREVGGALLAMLALSWLIGTWAARRIGRPIIRVARVVGSMDVDDATPEFPDGLTGEAAMVAEAFERAWTELQARKSELEASNRELSQFAYVASHDLQEPLRTISTFIKLLEEEQAERLDEEGLEFLDFIRRASDRMRGLVHDLLEYSRIGRIHVDGDVELGLLAHQVIEDLGTRIEECGGHVEVGPLPQVRGHEGTLRTLLLNLLNNGLKFSREGTIPRVRLSAEREGKRWSIVVDDNGIGIPEEHRERVFLIFQRLHGTSKYEGSGIGLAHCKKIVEQHGGKIHIEDSPLGGCRVRFDLGETR